MIAVTVAESSGTFAARRAATTLASELRFDETDTGKVAIIVTEMATNLLKHAGSGQILMTALAQGEKPGLEILAIDSGPGMASAEACLRDGYSTAGSSGTGLGAILRLAADSEIYSVPGQGTIVRAWFLASAGRHADSAGLDIGGVSVPVQGEVECGDAFAFRHAGTETVFLVADGLGHGPLAAEASRAAAEVLHRTSGTDVGAILDNIHIALKGTRGAAVAVAALNPSAGVIRYSGIGNIVAVTLEGTSHRHFVSMHGIVGQQIRSPRTFEYEWNDRCVLVFHSDGISNHWDLDGLPGITRRSAVVVAGAIYRAARRRNDDATVLVVKSGLKS